MKKVNTVNDDELRSEYKSSDFPGGLKRGEFAKQIRESSNIVVLRPEVTDAFPNEDAVNEALLSLIEIAQKSTRAAKSSATRTKKQKTG